MTVKKGSSRFPTRSRTDSSHEKQDTKVLGQEACDETQSMTSEIRLGMLLHQRYQILEEIGQGGMGEIWKAKDLNAKNSTSSYVAVKRILLSVHSQNLDELRQRFQRECIFLTSIKHPNLVSGIEYFEEGKDFFLIMEWVDGIPLNTILEKHPKIFSFIEQVAIAYQICRGFEILHLSGVLHRDIKPGNIMVNPNTGAVKILDLGLAKSLVSRTGQEGQPLTQPGAILGTIDYLSPEQLDGDSSPYSDIFSLGVLLYQFFAWMPQSPFRANSLVNTLENIQQRELIPLPYLITWPHSSQEAQCYQSLGKIFAECLQKKSSQRLHDDGILIHELETIYKTLSPLPSHPCREQWKLKTLAPQMNRQEYRPLQKEYEEDDNYQRTRTRRQNRNAQNPLLINSLLICIVLILLLLGTWTIFSSPVPIAPSQPSTSTQWYDHTSSQTTSSQTPSIPTQPESSVSTSLSHTPEVSTLAATLSLEHIQNLDDDLFSLELTEQQLLEEKVAHLKRKEKIDQVIRLRDQARSQGNEQLETQYQIQLIHLFCQDKNWEFTLRAIYNISQHTPESLFWYIKLAQKSGYRIHYIYALRLFLKKFPQHPKYNQIQHELEALEKNLDQEINSSEIDEQRKKLRRLLYRIGYVNLAQWNCEDAHVQEYVADIEQIISNQFPDLMPWLSCIHALQYIHKNEYQQAQNELKQCKQPLRFHIPVISLYNGQYFWPEITYIEGILAFAQGDRTAAMSKSDWLQKYAANYPLHQGNQFETLFKFYQNVDAASWKQQLRNDMGVLSNLLVQRAFMNVHTLGRIANTQAIIAIYQDLLFVEHMQHMVHFKLGIIFYQNKQYATAEQHFIYAKKLSHEFYEAIFYLGLIYYATNRWKESEQCFLYCTVFQPIWDQQMVFLSRQYLQELGKRKQKQK